MVIKDTLAPTFPVWFSRMWTDARPDTENLDKFVSWSRKLQSDLGFATCVNVYLLSRNLLVQRVQLNLLYHVMSR